MTSIEQKRDFDAIAPSAIEPSLAVSERVIYLSARDKRGIFAGGYDVYIQYQGPWIAGVIILSEMSAYPLGNLVPGNALRDLLSQEKIFRIIGRAATVETVITQSGGNFTRTPYTFMMHDERRRSSQATDGRRRLHLLADTEHLPQIARMRSDFIAGEIGISIDPERSLHSLERTWQDLALAVLTVDGEIAGMACSNFQSGEISMMNMVYVREAFRGQGNGRLLASAYEDLLFDRSQRVCLFHADHNEPARRLYCSLGYAAVDRWMMAMVRV